MRDIFHPRDIEPKPDRPPRPEVVGAPRRKAAGIALGAFLTLALLFAGVGTIVASFRGISGSPFSGIPFGSLFASFSDTYHRFTGVAGSSLELLKIGRDALALAPDLMQGKRGEEFISLLGRAETEFKKIGDTSLVAQIGARGTDLGTATGAFRTWLVSQPERHVAVVFGNSAEMRAGGGFIGSYAEVTLKGGAVSGITVHDINDADTISSDHTIPPVPLEPVADRWRAADANWFLSGPHTGEAFVTLINRSPLYKEHPIDAAIFVAPRAVSDLLALTGPVTEGSVTVDEKNFLSVIQTQVQAGQAAGDVSPKAILANLVPAFSQKLISGFSSQPLAVLSALENAFWHRDIIVYIADPAAQRSLETLGITGSLYATDARYIGGYVAVAPSTIGGDKTDAVTDEAIHVREQLLPKGLVETAVGIERTHRGTSTDAWWYKEDNRSYVKVYAPEGATPTKGSGIWQRARTPAKYDSSFTAYAPLAASVSTLRTYADIPGVDTFDETGKTVFGFWQKTARGTSSFATVTYARQLAHALQAGDTYDFVIERQPASTATYDVEVFAPQGLVFSETNTAQYTWHSDDPSGRTFTELHLVTAP